MMRSKFSFVSFFLGLGRAFMLVMILWISAGAEIANGELGTNWSELRFPLRIQFTSVVFQNRIWLIGGSEGTVYKNDVWSSPDGKNWILVSASADFSPRIQHSCVVFQNKLWVIGGYDGSGMKNDVWYSDNGKNWQLATSSPPFAPRIQHSSLVYQGKIWIIGGLGLSQTFSDVWYSDNGSTWNLATWSAGFSPRYEHHCVVFGQKMWVIGGNSDGLAKNDVWSSDNGTTWTMETNAAGFSPRWGHDAVVYGTMMLVVGGCGGAPGTNLKNDIWYSNDGVNWIQMNISADFMARYLNRCVVLGEKIIILGGCTGQVNNARDILIETWIANNGNNWMRQLYRQLPIRDVSTYAVYDNKMWVLAGSGTKDVWSSSDGLDWTQVTASAEFSARSYLYSVVFHGKLWVIGGWDGTVKNDVWCTSNGLHWTQVTPAAAFPPRTQCVFLVYNDKIWLIGGQANNQQVNDVWYTSDGKDWFQATPAAQFSPRAEARGTVFNGKMWIVGGYSGPNHLNDVWWSNDGAIWFQATSSADFAPRWGHALITVDNWMFVIGGNGGDGINPIITNDVWYTTDGSKWYLVASSFPYAGRFVLGGLNFGEGIWIIGGRNSSSIPIRDTWYSGKNGYSPILARSDSIWLHAFK